MFLEIIRMRFGWGRNLMMLDMKKKKVGSIYKYRKDAKTFEVEFFYVNFLDNYDNFNSEFSEQANDFVHALNKAKWYVNHRGALSKIDYFVRKIGVYSSIRGHIKSIQL